MRSGKPGFERLRNGLHKLGQMDLLAAFVDHNGTSQRVQFPSAAVSTSILRPRITSTSSFALEPDSKLFSLREALTGHDFDSEKSRKRKRPGMSTIASEEQEDTGLFVQEILEAVALPDLKLTKSGSKESMMRLSIDGLLHPCLAQKLLKHLTTSQSCQLVSMTAQTIPNAPIDRCLKRDGLSDRDKGRMNGKEERATDDSRMLDGWSVILGSPGRGKTRFVFVNSASH